MDYEQVTAFWHHFITHKLNESTRAFPSEVSQFFQHARVDFLDIETLNYLEYGDITIRYFDLIDNEEEVEIRLVDSVEDRFEPQWGLMGKSEKTYFHYWLNKRFQLNEAEIHELLLYVELFLRAVLKKQAE